MFLIDEIIAGCSLAFFLHHIWINTMANYKTQNKIEEYQQVMQCH